MDTGTPEATPQLDEIRARAAARDEPLAPVPHEGDARKVRPRKGQGGVGVGPRVCGDAAKGRFLGAATTTAYIRVCGIVVAVVVAETYIYFWNQQNLRNPWVALL